MGRLVMINGVVRSAEEQTVSVFDRGFLYGDSVFETVRTYRGRPFALNMHLKRLSASAGRVYIPLPVSLETIEAEVLEAVAGAENTESYIRIMLTRGEGSLGLDPALAEKPLRIVIISPLQSPKKEFYCSGIRVASFRTQRSTDATAAAGAKVGNYLVSVLAMRHAKQQGAVEALIVDATGGVVEGATSNIFSLFGDTLRTPSEEAGILAGITRKIILELAPSLGLKVVFETPTLLSLQAADEVFITSSIRELMPVSHVDGVPIGRGGAGAVSLDLLRAFRDHCLGITS